MSTQKKTTTKAVKPKFGEVGFEFPLTAKIIATSDDSGDYAFILSLNLGDYADLDQNDDLFVFYEKEDFHRFYSEVDPKFAKNQKLEELKKAQAVVAKLTKEFEAMK